MIGLGILQAPESPGLIESLGRDLENFLLPFMARFVAEGSHFAAGLAYGLIAAACIFLLTYGAFILLPSWAAIAVRRRRLRKALKSGGSDVERRRRFAEQFDTEVDPVMTGADGGVLRRILILLGGEHHLRLAWSEFKETFVDDGEEAKVLRNTARPQNYFLRAVKNPGRLGGLSGLLVSVGLLLTFVGIIAVLMKAGCEMNPGGANSVCSAYNAQITAVEMQLSGVASAPQPDGGGAPTDAQADENIQTAVISIVAGAASKFYASIGGLFASILVKVGLGVYAFVIRREVEGLADNLESGLAFVPEQHLALEQLELVREQSNQLKKFNTDLAVAIDQAVAPVTEQLGGIKTSLDSQNEATLGALKDGVGSAINTMAGGEIRELGRVLGDLKTELGGLSGKLNEGGEEAARRMESASKALEAMADQLEKRFAAVNESAEQTSAEANIKMLEAAAGMNEVLTGALRKIDDSAGANAEHLRSIGQALEGLTTGVASNAQSAFSDAFAKGAEETRKAAAEAGAELTRSISEASGEWRASLESSTDQLKELRKVLETTSSATARQADALEKTTAATRSAGDVLNGAASELGSAARPIASALQSVQSAAQTMGDATAKLEDTFNGAINQASGLAERMSATASAAEEAWAGYRARFAEVDEDLEKALQAISEAMGKNADGMRRYVSELDGQMGKAVNSFASAVQPLSDLAEELGDVAETLKAAKRESA